MWTIREPSWGLGKPKQDIILCACGWRVEDISLASEKSFFPNTWQDAGHTGAAPSKEDNPSSKSLVALNPAHNEGKGTDSELS